MAEEFLGDEREKISGVLEKGRRTVRSVEWRINPEAIEAREELFSVREAAVSLDYENPPGTLKLDAGGKEYVSIRRIEGSVLLRTEDNPNDIDESKTIFELYPKLIPDGGLGILIVPFPASCVNEDLAGLYRNFGGWTFPAAIYDGVVYNPNDWEIRLFATSFVKRIGNSFFRIPGSGISSFSTDDVFDNRHFPQKLEVNKTGKVVIDVESGYLSQQEIEIRRDWHRK